MANISRRQQVFCDLDETAAYLQEESPELATKFLTAAEAAMTFLADHPGIGHVWDSPHPGLKDVRTFPVKGLPKWIVFYRPCEAGIEVIRVLHGARDLPNILEEEQ